MKYPLSAYSWEILSESVAIKQMDKSAFLHHGTGIPQEIAPFFDLTVVNLSAPKKISIKSNGKEYSAYFQMDAQHDRFRLFWKSDFSNLIKKKYPNFHKSFSNYDSVTEETPKMCFMRTCPDVFSVKFIDPSQGTNDWTDEELEAAIRAYFDMLGMESRNEPYNKAEFNRKLRSSVLIKRSKGSVEFRMQNVSAVLQELCHPIIKGYLPRGNVGAEVSERIKRIIFDKKFLQGNDYIPTADTDDLDHKVESILKQGIIGKPTGQNNPQKQKSVQISYERDPLVKAWVIQNAGGICELCGKQGPFKDKAGQYFLEGHHVVFLSDGGEDTIENTVALCPNCHKKCHFAKDTVAVREEIRGKVFRIQ